MRKEHLTPEEQSHLRRDGLLAEADDMWLSPNRDFVLEAYEAGRKRRRRVALGGATTK